MQKIALLLATLLATSPLWAQPVTARQAATCKTQASCAYFGDVYNGDRAFRTAVQAVFRGSGNKATQLGRRRRDDTVTAHSARARTLPARQRVPAAQLPAPAGYSTSRAASSWWRATPAKMVARPG